MFVESLNFLHCPFLPELPKEGPELHGMKTRYKLGSKLKVECISRDALPAANLSFYINSESVSTIIVSC
jgi:hypothetical protein